MKISLLIVAIIILSGSAPVNASIAEGEALYNANCLSCHGIDGWGRGPYPSIVGIVERTGYNATSDIIQSWHRATSYVFDFNQEEVADIVSYVETLGTSPRTYYWPGCWAGPWWGYYSTANQWAWPLTVLLAGALVFMLLGALREKEPGITPLKILNARYARGEITKEEYQETKRVIKR